MGLRWRMTRHLLLVVLAALIAALATAETATVVLAPGPMPTHAVPVN
jgi:hypothetical protein